MRKANRSLMSIFFAGAAALSMTLYTGHGKAAKPETLPPVNLEFSGGEVEGMSLSFGVTRKSKGGNVRVEIVVRDLPLSVPAAMDELDPDFVCFAEPNGQAIPDTAGAAGMLTLYDDYSADFDLYASFQTTEGDLQDYNFFLDGGAHEIDLNAQSISGTVRFDLDASNMDVDTEGRGKKPKSCRGTVDLSATEVSIGP